jgi:hypothetical protein
MLGSKNYMLGFKYIFNSRVHKLMNANKARELASLIYEYIKKISR